jgi:hypothetical protein
MLAFVLNYAIFDIYAFYILTYVAVALMVSLGATAVADGAAWLVPQGPLRHRTVPISRIIDILLLLAVVWPRMGAVGDSVRAGRITFLDTTDFANFPYPVRTPDAPHQAAAQLIGQIEDTAIVFTNWAGLFTVYYVAHIEQGRTGITVHEWFDDGDAATNESALRYLDATIEQRPIYFTFIPANVREWYAFTPVGSTGQLFRVVPRDPPPTLPHPVQ